MIDQDKYWSPRSFMEQRRPGSFSDTDVVKESQLDSLKLEYHLDTLSTRKQEYDFEEFARKLCQLEIQPNLRPQTGPVGGGDGKVDTETTPVSEEIKDTYYFGVEKTSNEPWGFAFSTTVKWKTKVQSDVKKMVETDRGYKRLFFVTSRFIKADQRAKVEDELTKQYGVPVTIHDRTWISDKVFGNKRQGLAIEELKIDPSYKEVVKVGPKDTDRQASFEKLNKGIEEAVQEDRANFAIVDDAISIAIIAAKMNKPKTDVEGLFVRAKRLAEKYGSSEQVFTAKYQEIWTLYFWYNDYDILINNYQEIESLTDDTVNIFAVERLNNLFSLLRTIAVTTDKVEVRYVAAKKKILQDKLQAFKDDESRPSASLQAEEMLQIMEIPDAKDDQNAMSAIFDNLNDIVDRSTGLLGFSLETLYKLMSEMNDFYSGNQSFEALQDKLVDVISERKSSTEAAHVLLERTAQHIEGKRFYKAIACLGKTLVPLYKEEERGELVIALAQLSFAYEAVGLLWAARSAMLHAASYATMDFHSAGEINKLQLLSYARLRLLELRLGRVGYSLDWHRLNHLMNEQFLSSKEGKEKLLQDDMFYGAQLGLLLIKTPDSTLPEVELLPDTLMSMDLDLAAYGLIYRLGGKNILLEIMPEKMADTELGGFFNSYMTQPLQRDLPQEPAFYSGEKVILKSVILGTTFIVEAENQSSNIEIGEYILASLEGFLATTMEMDSYGNKSVVKISVTKNSSLGVKVSHEIKKDGSIAFDVTCGDFNPHSLKRSEQDTIYSDVFEIVVDIIGNSISFRDAHTDLEKLFRDENVGVRAFTFSSPLVVQGNVLGYKPKRDIKDWMPVGNKRYEYNKAESDKLKSELLANPREDEEEEKEKRDRNAVRHDQMENVSIIEEHLWNEAGWEGIAYIVFPDRPPVLAVMFTNEEKAKAIFHNWTDRFGREDKDEVIRVATIMGFTKANPLWYKFVISTNLGDPKDSKGKLILNAGRTHTMTPQTLNNLNGFIENYNRWGYYLIAPSFIKDKKSFPPEVFFGHGIVKKTFVNKNAWEIGPIDPEIMGLRPEDNAPVIPEGVTNPPILETIKTIFKK
uniref:Uncharacterized protein n=1 Tax=Candidatus Nitrotoga fabula TaxID=2182327 RepID=A0A2X0QUS3_9PROT|nr:conserved protein of unknown function [Candidatus Nitrotoga fabula]